MTQLVYLRTKAGRVFLTEPDSLASKGCLRGFALEVPSVGGPAATLATATGATCDGMDPCNTHYSARLVARAGSVSYSCQRGGESHSISAPPPSFAP
jgi:hypothetical protein